MWSAQVASNDATPMVFVVYLLAWPLLGGEVRSSSVWSTSQLLRQSVKQFRHSSGVCPQIQGLLLFVMIRSVVKSFKVPDIEVVAARMSNESALTRMIDSTTKKT